MASSLYLSTVGKVLNWARSSSLWYSTTGAACCADEVLSALGARYDLERFGCVKQLDPAQCDLLIVSGVIIVVLGCALVWLVGRLLRSNRDDVQIILPLVQEQKVNLPAAGEMVLRIEMPRVDTDHRRLQFEIVEPQSGKSITMAHRGRTNSGATYALTTMKVPAGRMTVSHPGSYVIRVAGMTPGKDYSVYRLMFSRPYLGRMAFQIVGLALCGVGMLLSLLWGLWLMGLLTSGTSS